MHLLEELSECENPKPKTTKNKQKNFTFDNKHHNFNKKSKELFEISKIDCLKYDLIRYSSSSVNHSNILKSCSYKNSPQYKDFKVNFLS